MEDISQSQAEAALAVKHRIDKLNLRRRSKITQQVLEKRLGINQADISRAFAGNFPKYLVKIEKYVTRLEREQEERRLAEPKAA